MSTVRDSNGNILNPPAPGTQHYSADGLTIDWFKTLPGRIFLKAKAEAKIAELRIAEDKRYEKAAAELKAANEKIAAEVKALAEKAAAEVKAVEAKTVAEVKAIVKAVEKVVNETPRSGNDVPSVQLPSERVDTGLAPKPAVPQPAVPSASATGNVVKPTSSGN